MAFWDTDSDESQPAWTLKRTRSASRSGSPDTEVDQLLPSPACSPLKKKYRFTTEYKPAPTTQEEDDAIQRQWTQKRIRLLQQQARNEAQDTILHATPNTKRIAVKNLRDFEQLLGESDDEDRQSSGSISYDGDASDSSYIERKLEAAAAEEVTRVLQSADGIDMTPGNTLLFTALDDKRLLHNGEVYVLQTEKEMSLRCEETLHLKAEVARQDRTLQSWRCLAAEVADGICTLGYQLNDVSLGGFPEE